MNKNQLTNKLTAFNQARKAFIDAICELFSPDDEVGAHWAEDILGQPDEDGQLAALDEVMEIAAGLDEDVIECSSL